MHIEAERLFKSYRNYMKQGERGPHSGTKYVI